MRSINLPTYFFGWLFKIIRCHRCYYDLLMYFAYFHISNFQISVIIFISCFIIFHINQLMNLSKQKIPKVEHTELFLDLKCRYRKNNLVQKWSFPYSVACRTATSYGKVQLFVLDRKRLFSTLPRVITWLPHCFWFRKCTVFISMSSAKIFHRNYFC